MILWQIIKDILCSQERPHANKDRLPDGLDPDDFTAECSRFWLAPEDRYL